MKAIKNWLLHRTIQAAPAKLPTDRKMQIIAVKITDGWFARPKVFLMDIGAFLTMAHEVVKLDPSTITNKGYEPSSFVSLHPKVREASMRVKDATTPQLPLWAFPEVQSMMAQIGKDLLRQVKSTVESIEKYREILKLDPKLNDEQIEVLIKDGIEACFGDASLFTKEAVSGIPTDEKRTLH